MNRILRDLSVATLLALLVACARAPEPAPAAPPVAVPEANPAPPAAVVAPPSPPQAETLPPPPKETYAEDDGPDCPAILAAEVNGPDIAGLYLGMSAVDAMIKVQCRLPKASVQWERHFLSDASSEDGAPQAFTAREGVSSKCNFNVYLGPLEEGCEPDGRKWYLDERVRVAAPGLPGEATVTAIWRSQFYDDEDRPSVNAVRTALREKYGEPQYASDTKGHGSVTLGWARDTRGAPLNKVNPLAKTCIGAGLNPVATRSQSWRSGCGLTIKALIELKPYSDDLVESLHVAMMDQDKLMAVGTALRERAAAQERKQREEKLKKADASKVNL